MNTSSSNESEKELAGMPATCSRSVAPLGSSTNQSGSQAVPMVPLVDVIAVQVDTQETVQVTAPSDLPAGYQFNVQLETRKLRVEVPHGGVRSGQVFPALVISDGSVPFHKQSPWSNVPMGAWRDGLFDCFKLGICHPLLCLTFLAPPVSLGQILTRLNLNACVEPVQENPSCCSAFRTMVCLVVSSIFASVVLGQFIEAFCLDDDPEEGVPDWLLGVRFSRVGLSAFYYLFVLIAGIRTRWYLRQKYQIHSRCCGQCEDVVCVVCCYSCVVCQMARHTVDYENGRKASCCSENGLRKDAEDSSPA